MDTSYEKPVQSQVFATKGYVPAFKRKQESDVEVVQRILVRRLAGDKS